MKRFKLRLKGRKRLKWGDGRPDEQRRGDVPEVKRKRNSNIGCLIFSILFVSTVIIYAYMLEFADSIADVGVGFMVLLGLLATAVVLRYLFARRERRRSTVVTVMVVTGCVALMAVSVVLLTQSVEVWICMSVLSLILVGVAAAYLIYRRRR